MGIIFEIILSFISLIIPLFKYPLSDTHNIISISFRNGGNLAALFTPLTSIIGSILGIKNNKLLWKRR